MKRAKPSNVWTKEDLKLIEAVKQHRNLYTVPICTFDKLVYRRQSSVAWDDVSSKLGLPVKKVSKKWTQMKRAYKEAIIKSKYYLNKKNRNKLLDGTLDFLKPWALHLANITEKFDDEEIERLSISSTEEDNDSDIEAPMSPPFENIDYLNVEESSERDIETTDPLTSCSSQNPIKCEEQVVSDVKSDVTNSNDERKIWTQEDLTFIEAVKPHKSLYTVPACTSDRELNKKESAMAWKAIALQLDMPAVELRHKWRTMKNSYKEALTKEEDSSKLLDGTLDFLKPWVTNSNDEIIDSDEMESSSSSSAEEDSVMHVDNSDSDSEATTSVDNKLNIQESSESDMEITELITSCSGQYAINYEKQVLRDVKVTNANDQSISNSILTEKKKEIYEVSQHHEKAHHSDLLSEFFARYDNDSDNSNLVGYFRHLAEVLCIKLAPAKRANFIRQIDLIVSQTLIDVDDEAEEITI